MTRLERAALTALHRLDPERAHDLSLRLLRAGLAPAPGPVTSSRLATTLAGMALPNPVGLAAGYDKNAVAVGPLSRAGFGWLEVGAATPRPQPGNAKPRLFRDPARQAVTNRFGFNNDGMDAVCDRLAAQRPAVPVGLNLGANRDSADRAGDYVRVLVRCAAAVDFATVNVSSPNTAGLRDLQGAEALAALLRAVLDARDAQARRIPVFLKIAPDLDNAALAAIAEVAQAAGLDAIVATNTTVTPAGGLSGQPLFDPSTRVLARLSALTGGAMPLIGTGGVASAAQAYAKIRAGACAVQLYTGLVYGGLSLAVEIARGLDGLLARDGFDTVAAAVGTGRQDWL